jgi:hypothetical protein
VDRSWTIDDIAKGNEALDALAEARQKAQKPPPG